MLSHSSQGRAAVKVQGRTNEEILGKVQAGFGGQESL